jgi:hypothetical protein
MIHENQAAYLAAEQAVEDAQQAVIDAQKDMLNARDALPDPFDDKAFEEDFNKICESVVWTTDFEEEYDPDEQWEYVKEKMFLAVSEVYDEFVTAEIIVEVQTDAYIQAMDEWLPLVS